MISPPNGQDAKNFNFGISTFFSSLWVLYITMGVLTTHFKHKIHCLSSFSCKKDKIYSSKYTIWELIAALKKSSLALFLKLKSNRPDRISKTIFRRLCQVGFTLTLKLKSNLIFLTAPNFVNISNFPHFSFFSRIQLPYFNRKPISVIDIWKACDLSFSVVPSKKIQGTKKLGNFAF